MNTIWLASYPRSGNTLLRTILWQCFALKSGSVYPNDLGGNSELETYVGHIEQKEGGIVPFEAGSLPLVKTHKLPAEGDTMPAIYVVRDPRAAIVSLWKFYQTWYGKDWSVQACIKGEHMFGAWDEHLNAWHPWNRPRTLFMRYEDLIDNLPRELSKLSTFLNREILRHDIPPRESIADGQWVRKKTNWKEFLTAPQLIMMNKRFGPQLRMLSYPID
jgi:hypothetical protein